MVLPAVAIGIVTSYFGFADAARSSYTEYVFALQVAVTIFLGSQSPAAMSRDLRFRVAPLYFSRPLSRQQYVQAKYAGMAAALFILIGAADHAAVRRRAAGGAAARRAAARLPARDGRRRHAGRRAGRHRAGRRGDDPAPRARGGRRGRRAARALRASRPPCAALAEEFGNDTFAGYAGLISPYTLVDGVVAGAARRPSRSMATPAGGRTMGAAVFCLVAVAAGRRLLRRPAGSATGRRCA